MGNFTSNKVTTRIYGRIINIGPTLTFIVNKREGHHLKGRRKEEM